MNTERFHNIEDIIGYTFRDLDLLVTSKLTDREQMVSDQTEAVYDSEITVMNR